MIVVVFYVIFYFGEAISLSDEIIVFTKRPARIKSKFKINFEKDLLPTERRRTELFNKYYDVIWKEIDSHVL